MKLLGVRARTATARAHAASTVGSVLLPRVVRLVEPVALGGAAPARSAAGGGVVVVLYRLALGDRGGGLALHVREDMPPAAPDRPRSPADRILEALGGATEPLTRR